MKKLIVAILILSSCKGKDYKYCIKGYVKTSKGEHSAIAYTDTINGIEKDSVWYFNSDSSKLTIYSPYTIDTIK